MKTQDIINMAVAIAMAALIVISVIMSFINFAFQLTNHSVVMEKIAAIEDVVFVNGIYRKIAKEATSEQGN